MADAGADRTCCSSARSSSTWRPTRGRRGTWPEIPSRRRVEAPAGPADGRALRRRRGLGAGRRARGPAGAGLRRHRKVRHGHPQGIGNQARPSLRVRSCLDMTPFSAGFWKKPSGAQRHCGIETPGGRLRSPKGLWGFAQVTLETTWLNLRVPFLFEWLRHGVANWGCVPMTSQSSSHRHRQQPEQAEGQAQPRKQRGSCAEYGYPLSAFSAETRPPAATSPKNRELGSANER